MFYKVMKIIATILARILYRFNVTGMHHIPNEGAFLLCPNHIHGLDAVMLAVFSKRQLRFMAKKELFSPAVFGAFFRALGVFPVNRGGADMQAFRHSMNVLKSGQGLLIFAQGTRMKEFENAKGGVALFALKSGAPIVPVGISGSYRIFSKLNIHVGQPIPMEKYQGEKVKSELIEEVMESVTNRITQLC